MVNSPNQTKKMVRLPEEVQAFIANQAERNGSSQNSEIIRCIRERMDAVRSSAESRAG